MAPEVIQFIIQPLLKSEDLYLGDGGTVHVVHELHALSLHNVTQDEPRSKTAASSVYTDTNKSRTSFSKIHPSYKDNT